MVTTTIPQMIGINGTHNNNKLQCREGVVLQYPNRSLWFLTLKAHLLSRWMCRSKRQLITEDSFTHFPIHESVIPFFTHSMSTGLWLNYILPKDHPIQLVQDPIDIKIATRANCRSIYSLTWSQVQYTTTADLLHITTMQQFTILRGQLERIIILLFIFYSMSPRGDLKRNPF